MQFLHTISVMDPQIGDKWVMSHCPLAFATHKHGKDNKPSFGVNLASGKFNCFTCESGSLEKLLQLLEMYCGSHPEMAYRFDFKKAREILGDQEDLVEALPAYSEFAPEGHQFQEWPTYFLDQFPKWSKSLKAVWYLTDGRKLMGSQPVDLSVAEQMDLRWDAKYQRIVCPYHNVSDKLAGARGRAIATDTGFKHFDYTWNGVNNAALVWYNEQCFGESIKNHMPVVVVEGQFDCLNVLRVYPYVVANLTAKPSQEKLRKLQNCHSVVIMLDNDAAGEKGEQKYLEYLKGKIPVGVMRYPKTFKDPAQLDLQLLASLFDPLLSEV